MQPWCWAFADLLVPRSDCGVRGKCGPAAPSEGVLVVVARPEVGERPEWAPMRIPVGRLCGLCKWPVRVTCLWGHWAATVRAGGTWFCLA